jgi:tetratricopeptide (TPR) repeat protein
VQDAPAPAAARPSHSERDLRILRGFAQRIDAADAGAHNNLGVLYFNKGLYEEAIQQFGRALAIDRKMVVAQRNLEIAYFNTATTTG